MYVQDFEQDYYEREIVSYVPLKGSEQQVEWANDVRRLFLVINCRIDSKINLPDKDKKKKDKFIELIRKLDPIQAWIKNNDIIKYFKWENQSEDDIKKEFFQVCHKLCLFKWEMDELPDFEGWF